MEDRVKPHRDKHKGIISDQVYAYVTSGFVL
jgi:hypothetical protein